jgi:hypothetical protein
MSALSRLSREDSATRTLLSGLCCEKSSGISRIDAVRLSSLPRFYYEETIARTLSSRVCCHECIIKTLPRGLYYQDSSARSLLDSPELPAIVMESERSAHVRCHDSIIKRLLPGLHDKRLLP